MVRFKPFIRGKNQPMLERQSSLQSTSLGARVPPSIREILSFTVCFIIELCLSNRKRLRSIALFVMSLPPFSELALCFLALRQSSLSSIRMTFFPCRISFWLSSFHKYPLEIDVDTCWFTTILKDRTKQEKMGFLREHGQYSQSVFVYHMLRASQPSPRYGPITNGLRLRPYYRALNLSRLSDITRGYVLALSGCPKCFFERKRTTYIGSSTWIHIHGLTCKGKEGRYQTLCKGKEGRYQTFILTEPFFRLEI